MDLDRPETLAAVVAAASPDLIVNCAAYTAVDRAERDEAGARRVNSDAVAEIGRAARRLGAPVVHFSTDYVFPGDAAVPYRESDPTGPLSVYGRTKLLGERALAGSNAAHWIFRTSWVYAARGRNFVNAIVVRARDTGQLRIVDDQHGSPTWARTLAEVVGAVVAPHAGSRATLARQAEATGGVYHLTSRGETTWYGFARFVLERLQHGLGRPVEITPVTTAEFATAARRPSYSVLDTAKLRSTFGIALPSWQSAAALFLDEFGN
jgi:dTDP-4-dehydrorhamnose reductase